MMQRLNLVVIAAFLILLRVYTQLNTQLQLRSIISLAVVVVVTDIQAYLATSCWQE